MSRSHLQTVGVFVEITPVEEDKDRLKVVAAGNLTREDAAWVRDRLNDWLAEHVSDPELPTYEELTALQDELRRTDLERVGYLGQVIRLQRHIADVEPSKHLVTLFTVAKIYRQHMTLLSNEPVIDALHAAIDDAIKAEDAKP